MFDGYDKEGIKTPKPEETNFIEWSVGEIKREPRTDWRASLTGLGNGFHAVQFCNRFECHIDKFDPKKNLFKHLLEDSPGILGWVFATISAISGGSPFITS